MFIHPALSIPCSDLLSGLEHNMSERYINSQRSPEFPNLHIYSYTDKTVFDRNWNFFTCLARGLIIDYDTKTVIATPFPKFFNLGETQEPIPNEPFRVFTKLDGSLIILFYYAGKWRTATRGSFISNQALFAQNMIDSGYFPSLSNFNTDSTYLFELIGPNNKIVVTYPRDELILLGAYKNGIEYSYEEYLHHATLNNIKYADVHTYTNLSDLVSKAETELTKDEEGFVIHFQSGHRLKVKGSEYKRIHSLISRLSPLSVWEMYLNNPEQLLDMKRELPEELWGDFEQIISIIHAQLFKIVDGVEEFYNKTKSWSDKEVGLFIQDSPPAPSITRLIFSRRKFGSVLEGKARKVIFDLVRPTGNKLEGFTPGSSLNRIQGELSG